MLLAMARLYAPGTVPETPDRPDVEMNVKPGLTGSKKTAGDSDAHDRGTDNGSTGRDDCCRADVVAGARPDLRPALPDLPADVWHLRQLHRVRLHVDGPVPPLGSGPRGAVHRQSIFRGRIERPWLSPAAMTCRYLRQAASFLLS